MRGDSNLPEQKQQQESILASKGSNLGDVLDLCDERRDLKKKRYEAEGAKEYREANRRIQKAVKKAKEDWTGAQCEEIEICLNKINSKRAYQLVKDLTSEKQGRSSAIQDKSGKCLTEEKKILSRWTEYCSELYNYESTRLQPALGRRSATNPP